MRGAVAALVMAALLLLYLVLVAGYAIRFVASGEPAGIGIGVALFLLPLLGAWLLAAELLFTVRAERLRRVAASEGPLPADELPRLPSGRPDPRAADERFPRYREAVEAEPDSWRAWLRLGLAYDASGDRKRARWAVRRAVRLERGLPV